jgi:probable phosphoglycerate mutase
MATTVWLARHGEVHNPTQVLYGRLPRMPLTHEGTRQAEALARFLAPRRPVAVYSSPMLRARRTAASIAARLPDVDRVRIDRDLHEIKSGWQGEPLATLEQINWDFYSHPRHPEDESLAMIHARMQRWLRRVLKRHPGQGVVGVSHGDPILILVGALRGLPLDTAALFPQPYIETGTVFRMRFDALGNVRDVEAFVPHAEQAA